jgi:hypothetical protein
MANSSFDYTLLHKPLEFVFPIILQEELEWEGVWDFNRLSLPYVRCHILQQKFGDRWQEIASKYFYEYEHLCYQASVLPTVMYYVTDIGTTRSGRWLQVKSDQCPLSDIIGT